MILPTGDSLRLAQQQTPVTPWRSVETRVYAEYVGIFLGLNDNPTRLRCCEHVMPVLSRCADGVSIAVDVFADSRLVNPFKWLIHTYQNLEARVGIDRLDSDSTLHWKAHEFRAINLTTYIHGV